MCGGPFHEPRVFQIDHILAIYLLYGYSHGYAMFDDRAHHHLVKLTIVNLAMSQDPGTLGTPKWHQTAGL